MLTAPRLRRWMSDSLRPKILQAYADKTGAVVAGLAESACVIAGAGARERQECVAFAQRFGVAFQIIDDILDFDAGAKLRGRFGEDLAGGKLTYVIVSALERLSARTAVHCLRCSARRTEQPCTAPSRRASIWSAPPEHSSRAGRKRRRCWTRPGIGWRSACRRRNPASCCAPCARVCSRPEPGAGARLDSMMTFLSDYPYLVSNLRAFHVFSFCWPLYAAYLFDARLRGQQA